MKKILFIGFVTISFLFGLNTVSAWSCNYVSDTTSSQIKCTMNQGEDPHTTVDNSLECFKDGEKFEIQNWDMNHPNFGGPYQHNFETNNLIACPLKVNAWGYFYEYDFQLEDFITDYIGNKPSEPVPSIETYTIEGGNNGMSSSDVIAEIDGRFSEIETFINDFSVDTCIETCTDDDYNCSNAGYLCKNCYSLIDLYDGKLWGNTGIEGMLNDYKSWALDDDTYNKYFEKLEEVRIELNNLRVQLNVSGKCVGEGTTRFACGFIGEKTMGYIKTLYTIIKIIIPALIIVLGMIDFMKVLFSGEEKDMKTAGKRFLKRIIAGVIFILLPILLQFLIELFGFSENCLQEFWK